jgi:hypothetical protein
MRPHPSGRHCLSDSSSGSSTTTIRARSLCLIEVEHVPHQLLERAQRPPAAIRHFMAANNAVIMMVILLLLGAKLLGDGLASI